MRAFMDKDFLLKNDVARELYHTYAAGMPIIDYHCHVSPREIAEDKRFDNITQVWLGGDHYKWRQMRSNGVEERYITGDAPDYEKFCKWAETLEKAIGNPLFHWSHLELQRYFDYHGVLNSGTADEVWQLCNKKLSEPSMSARNIIKNSGVALLCTTDDPADDLRWHKIIAQDKDFDVRVLPAWRPDKAMNIDKADYRDYIEKLSEASKVSINSFDELCRVLSERMDYFSEMGCVAADHGLDYVMYEPANPKTVSDIFDKALKGEAVSETDILRFKTACILFLGTEYKKRGWVMQLHYGCKRDNNAKMYRKIGPDTGFDCISNYTPAAQVADLLNALDVDDNLPKTILYSLNPSDDAALGSIIGCFQNSDACGKIQQGSAWWFNDNMAGMRQQMISLANLGLLGNFVGMLTDSRSFLSYPRHEYFRRIMCNLIGEWVEGGEYPYDTDNLQKIVKGISYENAVRYFGFDLKTKM